MNDLTDKKTVPPVRCLVIQFARLGDTLQSLMALKAAQQLYPQLEIHFLARERFADAVKRVPWIKSVITFPSNAILGPVLEGTGSETQALRDVAHWVRPLVQKPWDLVLNWSYSEPSSYLTALMPARVKLGYSRAKDLNHSNPDGWSHYIQAIVQGGIHQNIHLTDVLTTQLLTALQIHQGEPADNGDAPVTSKNFFSLKPQLSSQVLGALPEEMSASWRDRSKRWIAVQLATSKDQKNWTAENWSALIDKITKNHPEYRIVLLGGKEDEELAKQIPANSRVFSLVGKTDFDLWASAVSRAQWLFSCDTAAIHLASVLGTRVMNLSLGSVRWAETGPYGNGHYVIATNALCAACEKTSDGAEHTCRDVSAESVYATWLYAAQDSTLRKELSLERHFAKLGKTEELAKIPVYRSKIRPSADGGGVVYEAMSPQPIRLTDWTAMAMGHIARAWYCGWVPAVGQELTRERISPALVKSLRDLEDSSLVLQKVCDEAMRTATKLSRHSSKLKSEKVMRLKDRQSINEHAQKLQELDALIERISKTHPSLTAFSQMANVLMHNLRGSQISELSQESADCYRQLQEGVTLLREWVKFTRALAKPVAISAQTQPGIPPNITGPEVPSL